MIFNGGKTVAELVAGRTHDELLEAANESVSNVTGDSNPYRDKWHYSRAREMRFYIKVVDASLEDYTVMANNGRWKVLDKYWFFSQSGKWSVVGKNTIYKSKGFSDFVERFLSKDYQYQKLVRDINRMEKK